MISHISAIQPKHISFAIPWSSCLAHVSTTCAYLSKRRYFCIVYFLSLTRNTGFHSLSWKLHKKRDCNDHKEVQNNQLVKLLSYVGFPTLQEENSRITTRTLLWLHAKKHIKICQKRFKSELLWRHVVKPRCYVWESYAQPKKLSVDWGSKCLSYFVVDTNTLLLLTKTLGIQLWHPETALPVSGQSNNCKPKVITRTATEARRNITVLQHTEQ